MRISFLIIVILTGACNTPTLPKTGLEGQMLPSFRLELADSVSNFNTSNVPKGRPIIFLLFNPYCAYCRAETAELLSSTAKLRNVRIYAITSADYKDMRVFYTYLKLNSHPDVIVGIDSSSFFANYFKVPGVPYMAIYDKQKRLKQVLIGKTPISIIMRFALE